MRLNLSHTTLPASKDYICAYQSAAEESGVVSQILIDMQGPELRVGKIEAEFGLETHEAVFLAEESALSKESVSDTEESGIHGDRKQIPVPGAIIEAAQIGDKILLDDGKILVEVVSVPEDNLKLPEAKLKLPETKLKSCDAREAQEELEISLNLLQGKVLRGGILRSHKSIKIQERNLFTPVLTEHDIENIKLAKEYGVTALMQPFVLSGDDLKLVRNVLKEHKAEDIQIFAKIENRLGVENIESILPEADVIIIARGDLGNDMPLWELPTVQKQIENKCKEYNKPYIVVTQMLASMESSPVPTRAEVSDIYHAVYHGAWGVMITGESAIGKYPVEAVRYLTNTAATVGTGYIVE